ncbi:MAG: hypothetical protein UZ21_OP11001000100 [Microgenomates bacterium OLB22]|nr:MAG: hypothetical protein UZ21_OP11001000100 [Microgenomates bacterium OLB22]
MYLGRHLVKLKSYLPKQLNELQKKEYRFVYNDVEEKIIAGEDLFFSYNFDGIRPILTRENKSLLSNLYAIFYPRSAS